MKWDVLRAMLSAWTLREGTLAYEHRHSEPLAYGLGLAIGTAGAWPLISHGGRINGFTGHLRSFPDARLVVVAGTGHLAHYEAPAAVAEAVIGFL